MSADTAHQDPPREEPGPLNWLQSNFFFWQGHRRGVLLRQNFTGQHRLASSLEYSSSLRRPSAEMTGKYAMPGFCGAED